MDGYARTSLRAIARDTDVDHALISYYYGPKESLFEAVTELVLSPAQVLDAVIERVPERLLGRVSLEAAITAWDHPAYQHGPSQLIADSMASPTGMRTLREYLKSEMVTRIARFIGGADASKRATPEVSIISGVFFARPLRSQARTPRPHGSGRLVVQRGQALLLAEPGTPKAHITPYLSKTCP